MKIEAELTKAQLNILKRLPRGYECNGADARRLVDLKLAKWEHPLCTGFLYLDRMHRTPSGTELLQVFQ